MRNISNNGLAILANRYGNEPINIVEVDWYTDAEGNPATSAYADRDIPGPPFIPGKIVGAGALDSVVDIVLGNGSSAQLELTLDDTDGSIKSFFDRYDLHNQNVRVFQWFSSLALSDKFLVFAGKINTPVTWNERDRTVKFTVLTHLEDQEVGFSPEQGQFQWLPSAMCGKAWPMIFGTTQDVPATQITRICQAVTITPVGIVSMPSSVLPMYANGLNTDLAAYQTMAIESVKINLLQIAARCWAKWESETSPSGLSGETIVNNAPVTTIQQITLEDGSPASVEVTDNNPCKGVNQQAMSLQYINQANVLIAKIEATQRTIKAKESCITLSRKQSRDFLTQTVWGGGAPVQTLGGEDFPQNTPIWINIGGGSFYGHFVGNLFYIANSLNVDDAAQLATDLMTFQEGTCIPPAINNVVTQSFDISLKVPCGSDCDSGLNSSGNTGVGITDSVGNPVYPNGLCGDVPACTPVCTMREVGCVSSPTHYAITLSGSNFGIPPSSSSWVRMFWKEGGQQVVLESAEPISYVASIVPGKVLCVKSFKQYDGPHLLTTVPTDYYTVSTVNYGPIIAVIVTMARQLSTYRYTDGTNQGWSNEIYVTFESSVGPNTVDIMKYLIDTYTTLTWDNDSFNYCAEKLAAFPSNFALMDTKNIIDLLRDIAFQARCAIWISDNVFYMKYLPEEPTLPNFSLSGVVATDPTTWGNDPTWAALPPSYTDTTGLVTTSVNPYGVVEHIDIAPGTALGISTPQNRVVDVIQVSDIDSEKGVEVGYTPTENVCTKMKVTWRQSLAPDNPYPSDAERHEQTMVLRHNLAKYGLHEKSFNWFIYNQPDIILKCATFWLIRMSTTWKTLKFRTFLNKLNLETLDAVLFDDGGKNYASSGPIPAVVKKANYKSADNCIEFELELPVKAGEKEYYPFYWPSKLAKSATWPPADEIASGAAGGGGIGVWATGSLPIGVLNGQISGQTVFVGGPNVVYGSQSDRGDPTPTDQDFTAQPTFQGDSITINASQTRPYVNTNVGFLNNETVPVDPDLPSEITLDLYRTKITNFLFPGAVGRLGDFFSLSPKGGLRMELAVAQTVDNSLNTGPLGVTMTTSGTDCKLGQLLSVSPAQPSVEPPIPATLNLNLAAPVRDMVKGLSGLLSDVFIVRTNDDSNTNAAKPAVLALNVTSWIVDPTSLAIGMFTDVFTVLANPDSASTAHPTLLMVNGTSALFVTTDCAAGAVFDFKYDTTGLKMGAGTAFLQATSGSGGASGSTGPSGSTGSGGSGSTGDSGDSGWSSGSS